MTDFQRQVQDVKVRLGRSSAEPRP